jgi:hypothetical protein
MASIGDTTRPAFAYDQATDTWVPVGVGPHSHTPAAIGAISNSLTTTTGDMIYAASANTPARLGIGSTGQVLSVSGGVPAWATASGWNPNYTLLNAGGTSLTGSTDITVSGISGKNALLIYVQNASSANGSSEIKLRVNDGGDCYFTVAYMTDTATNTIDVDETSGGYWLESYSKMGTDSSTRVNIVMSMQGTATSGAKPYTWQSYTNSSTNGQSSWGNGFTLESAITSVTVNSSTGNFDGGTLYVYGA